jgi:2-polyprenyl-3-methyl-5-hydroxy-6-metoxy-1,4-benzoquinol methylase
MLSECGSAVGLDVSTESIHVAAQRAPSASFICARLPAIPLPGESFDSIVSFETIEHVEDDEELIAEFRRVLRPGGLLLLSTPNAAVTSPDRVVRNPFHVREYLLDEILHTVRAFRVERILGQGFSPESALQKQALRAVARFPALCRPGRWWDRLAHGDDAVREVVAPTIIVLQLRRM